MSGSLLQLDQVSRTFSKGRLFQRRSFDAVRDVSFDLKAYNPEIFAIVGESGSGKTTLARMILNLETPTQGTIRFRGKNLAECRRPADRITFMQQVQPIFQNPFAAFNPLKKADRYLFATARRFLNAVEPAKAELAADEALQHVGLSLNEVRNRYPHELSGGQLQRIAIARALICKPALLVADEPVSMVDASLRMSIINLFRMLRDKLGVSIVYITHDLATAYYISDRIVIMQKGMVVESGDAKTVLSAPKHPYSQLLMSSVLLPAPAEPTGPGI